MKAGVEKQEKESKQAIIALNNLVMSKKAQSTLRNLLKTQQALFLHSAIVSRTL